MHLIFYPAGFYKANVHDFFSFEITPGRAVRYLPAPPQTRTSAVNASGSDCKHKFCNFLRKLINTLSLKHYLRSCKNIIFIG